MKFAGKRRKSTEGVTLSGAGRAGATANGSTLWRHPDRMSRGPKVQDAYVLIRRNLSGKWTEKISIFLFSFQSLHKNFASLIKTKEV